MQVEVAPRAMRPGGKSRAVGVDFDSLRRSQYGRLDSAGHAYLDYTGAALYPASLIETHSRRLLCDVLGNPHSENPAAAESTVRMDRARRRVLAFVGADPSVYDVVFTANASAALRLVGESFPFAAGSRRLLSRDNHNSVNGIRCFAERAGAQVCCVPLERELRAADPQPWLSAGKSGGPHLFAFPAQSNFSGVRHPLEWVGRARALGYHVLLDAAALAPTSPLRLDDAGPDFVCLSFYKMFGFPTGIGALVARRESLRLLRRPWFGGGTVAWVSTEDSSHALRPDAQAFEDGTPHFLAFDAVCDGLDWLDGIGMERVASHVHTLTARLIAGLVALRHGDGRPLVVLYGPSGMAERGATVAFNVVDRFGRVVPFDEVVAAAAKQRVSVRGGCFCNPGCAELALSLPAARTRECRRALGEGATPARLAACIGGAVGAVRASLGVPTTAADIDRLLHVIEGFVTA